MVHSHGSIAAQVVSDNRLVCPAGDVEHRVEAQIGHPCGLLLHYHSVRPQHSSMGMPDGRYQH